MDGRTRNQDPGPVSGIRCNMRGRGQPSETGLLNVGMRRTWGVPSGLPSEVRKVGLSTPRPFNPPSRTAIRLVVLIANGTSDFASERSLRWELSPVNSPSRAKDCNLSTKYCSLSMVDFELCRLHRMPAWGTIYVVRIWNGLDSIAGGRAWETMSQAEIMTCGPWCQIHLIRARKDETLAKSPPGNGRICHFKLFLIHPSSAMMYLVDHAKPNFSKPQRDDGGYLS